MMADIKNFSIFGNENKGLKKIKNANQKENEIKNIKTSIDNSDVKKSISTTKKPSPTTRSKGTHNSSARSKNSKGAGAPIRNFDRIYVASQPLKLSALLNSTSRILTEKYLAQYTRDEILRLALDSYIKLNFTKEDKLDLFQDIMKELDLYREKNPTIPQIDSDGEILLSSQDIEKQSAEEIRKNWGL